MSEVKGFISQSAALTIASILSAGLSAVYVALIGRLLGPAEYGVVAAALSMGYLIALLAGPVENTVAQLAARYHGEQSPGKLATLTRGGLGRVAIATTICVGGLCLALPWIAEWLHFPNTGALFALAVYLAAMVLVSIVRGVLRGDHRFLPFGINQVSESAARMAGAWLVLIGWQAAGAVAGYAIGMLAALALGVWQLRDVVGGRGEPIEQRKLLSYSLPLLLSYVYFQAIVSIDVLAAKRVVSSVDAGYYGAASTVARLQFLVATPIYQVLFSRVTAQSARGASTRRLTLAVVAGLSVALAISYAVPWFFGEQVLDLVLGKGYAPAAPVLRILWITTSVLVVQASISFALLGTERTRGFWLYPLPAIALAVALQRYHGSMIEIALATLMAAGGGTLVLIVIGLLNRK